MKFFEFNKKKAQKLHEEGQRLSDEGNDDQAIELYKKAIDLDKEKSESYYNIVLIYKYRNDWERSLSYNQKAYQIKPEDEAARWNLAIAATALRQWDNVRKAWQDNEIELEGDSGPINMDFGITPIRLNPDDDGEVVWARRVDPVRARILNVPFKESGFKYGDIVLHDGAAEGYRQHNDTEYPVFNVLELFEASEFETKVISVEIANDDDLNALEERFEDLESNFEDWTSNTRILCKQCSEGTPHEEHDHELESEPDNKRTLAIAVHPQEEVHIVLQEWAEHSGAKLIKASAKA